MRIVAYIAFVAALGACDASAGPRFYVDEDGMLRPVLPQALSGKTIQQAPAEKQAAALPAPAQAPAPIAGPAAGVTAAVSTHQQDAGGENGLTRSLVATLETHPGLRASEARGRAARAVQWREWSALLPAIEAGGQVLRESGGKFGYGTVSVSMALFDAASYNRAKSAQSQAFAAWADSLATRDRLLISTAAAWLRGAYALAATAEYEKSVRQIEKLRGSVKARQGSGFASSADVSAVDVRLASLRRELAGLREVVAKAEAEIESITGGLVVLGGELPSDAAFRSHSDSELQSLTIARSPVLQSALHASDAARYQTEAAKGEYMPKLRVSSDYTSAGLPGYRPDGDDLSLGVRVSVPIFQPGYIASIAEKKELAEAARWQAQDVERNVLLQIETLLRERDAANEKRRQINAETAELNRLVASLDARYREGFGSIDELLNQQVALARARAQSVEVRTQQLYTQFQLMVLAGLADGQE